MSIASAIQNAQQKVANAYTAVQNKGGTIPATQDLSNLPTAINTITTSGTVETLNVTPTTSAQTITPSAGVDGFNPVNVSAVTSAIDPNITASNIVSGKSILGVNGSATVLNGETQNVSLTNKNGQTFTPSTGKNAITSITVTPNNQNRTVTPTTSQQSLTVNSGYSGNGTITVNAVTSAIDSDIQAGNIKSGVNILGVNGSVIELNGQTKTVSPTTSQQTITPDSPKNGLTSVTVNAVTSAIDSNITAGNIKDGITILGVTGTFDPSPTINSLNVTPTTSAQTITASGGVDGYSPVNVSAVTASIDSNITPNKIRNGVNILGVTGTYGEPLPRGVSLSYTTSGYLIDGDFYLCGRNNYGQQGNGTSSSSINVTTFTKRAESVAQIFCSENTSGYLTTSGDFYLCGDNQYGQQGSGDTTNVKTFTKRAENVAQVSISNLASGYLTTSGDFYLCGYNYFGQQGNGTSGSGTQVTTFTKVAENVTQILCGYNATAYITATGDFYLCGKNDYGQQGSGDTNNVTTFTKRASNVAQMSLSGATSGYLTTSGNFYLCGNNQLAQQGNGTSGSTNVTVFTKRASGATQIFCTMYSSGYLSSLGNFYLCGNNAQGTGGLVNTFTKRAENVAQISGTSGYRGTFSTSPNNYATGYITTSGDFYMCGVNAGQQGNVYTFTKYAENVAQMRISEQNYGYITTSGDFYLCGWNAYGQQGSGDTNYVYTFTKRN